MQTADAATVLLVHKADALQLIEAIPVQCMPMLNISSGPSRVHCRQDDVEIVDTEASDVFAAYCAEGSTEADREVVFHPTLGLAMEALPAGTTVEQLWNVG